MFTYQLAGYNSRVSYIFFFTYLNSIHPSQLADYYTRTNSLVGSILPQDAVIRMSKVGRAMMGNKGGVDEVVADVFDDIIVEGFEIKKYCH